MAVQRVDWGDARWGQDVDASSHGGLNSSRTWRSGQGDQIRDEPSDFSPACNSWGCPASVLCSPVCLELCLIHHRDVSQ